ncbi:MAG TPA: PQQ-dependent catabolism-associated beta-propeller protein [Pararhizobium sp.]|nr:PQQ-dependent catabolism-associated beta-propeller protein [Pararhizobium sp.]
MPAHFSALSARPSSSAETAHGQTPPRSTSGRRWQFPKNPQLRRLLARSVGLAAGFLIALASIAPAFAAHTGYVFVSNERSNTVTVVDPKKEDAIIKQIPTDLRPRDMQFNADHSLIYVACGDSDRIDVIDVKKMKVIRHIGTGPSPEMFALAPDGKSLYVSEEDSAIVRQIDIKTDKTLNQITTGPEPEGVLVTKDGSRIYITSEIADMVHVYDTHAHKLVDNIIVGNRPRRFAMTADHKELWVSDELSGEVTVIDPTTDKIKTTLSFLPPGFRPVDVTPVGLALSHDGQTMYVTLGRANHVAFVDAKTKKIEAYVLVGSRAWGIAETADGSRLYVANGLSDDVSVIDVAARKAIGTIPTGRVPHTVLIDD